jgi:hypothetical protein
MTKEMLLRELTLFWMKLRYFAGLLKDAPRIIWEGSAGVGQFADRWFVVLTAAAVAIALLAWVVRLLKAPWKEKPGILLHTLVVLFIVAIILFFSLRGIDIPA